jgi:hypothetical protein
MKRGDRLKRSVGKDRGSWIGKEKEFKRNLKLTLKS